MFVINLSIDCYLIRQRWPGSNNERMKAPKTFAERRRKVWISAASKAVTILALTRQGIWRFTQVQSKQDPLARCALGEVRACPRQKHVIWSFPGTGDATYRKVNCGRMGIRWQTGSLQVGVASFSVEESLRRTFDWRDHLGNGRSYAFRGPRPLARDSNCVARDWRNIRVGRLQHQTLSHEETCRAKRGSAGLYRFGQRRSPHSALQRRNVIPTVGLLQRMEIGGIRDSDRSSCVEISRHSSLDGALEPGA
jgi:hypothetical protein